MSDPDDARDVLDVALYLAAAKKAEDLGEDALTDDERAVLEQGARMMKKVARQWRKSVDGREEIMTLGMQIYRALPEELQERWSKLKPAKLTMLAMAFPDELPPDARRLLDE